MNISIFIGKLFIFLEAKKNFYINKYKREVYYSKIYKIGKCVRFNGISNISGFDSIEIEDNVHIGNNAHIMGQGGLFIGANTHISRNLVLYTVNHNYQGELLPYDNSEISKEVIIEKNVWIGMNVTILPGTHIEEGVIIGAGSVVAGKIPKLSIYGASIGKVIKIRDKKHYNRLNEEKKYGGINGNKLSKSCI